MCYVVYVFICLLHSPEVSKHILMFKAVKIYLAVKCFLFMSAIIMDNVVRRRVVAMLIKRLKSFGNDLPVTNMRDVWALWTER